MKSITIGKYIHILLAIVFIITVFLLPSNLFLVWRIPTAYINGHFIDYLAPKIYLSQLFIWYLWLATLLATRGRSLQIANFRLSRVWSIIMVSIVTILVVRIATQKDIATLSWLFNFFTGPVLFALWLWRRESTSLKNLLWPALILTTTFQAIVGIIQFFIQSELAGYWFLGEPTLHPSLPLAFDTISSVRTILPYGTTPHPNVLAGWLVIGMLSILIYWYISKKHIPWLVISGLVQVSCLWLTQSWSAILSLLFLLWMSWLVSHNWHQRFGFPSFKKLSFGIILAAITFWLTWWQWFPALTMNLSSNLPLEITSFSRRITLATTTLELIPRFPLGMSLPGYFQEIFQAENTVIGTRFLQPVHHAGLLIVILSGMWVILLPFIILIKAQKYYPLLFLVSLLILPIFNLDHYLSTLISGQYILILILYFFNILTNEK
jgi:hypothetical protein